MKFANVAGANQTDAEICILRHAGFLSHLMGVAINGIHLRECAGRTFAES